MCADPRGVSSAAAAAATAAAAAAAAGTAAAAAAAAAAARTVCGHSLLSLPRASPGKFRDECAGNSGRDKLTTRNSLLS